MFITTKNQPNQAIKSIIKMIMTSHDFIMIKILNGNFGNGKRHKDSYHTTYMIYWFMYWSTKLEIIIQQWFWNDCDEKLHRISHSFYISYSTVIIHLHIIWLNYNFRFYWFFYKESLGFVAFFNFFAWYIFMCFNFFKNKKSSATLSIRQKSNIIKTMVSNCIFFCFY